MRGVTQRVYDAFRERRGETRRPLRQIDHAELRAIYRRRCWDVIKGDNLPAGVEYAVFDRKTSKINNLMGSCSG